MPIRHFIPVSSCLCVRINTAFFFFCTVALSSPSLTYESMLVLVRRVSRRLSIKRQACRHSTFFDATRHPASLRKNARHLLETETAFIYTGLFYLGSLALTGGVLPVLLSLRSRARAACCRQPRAVRERGRERKGHHRYWCTDAVRATRPTTIRDEATRTLPHLQVKE